MAIQRQRKGGEARKRFLVSVNVLGSAGPIRFVVREGVSVGAIIDTALRSYAREGRRPFLGSDIRDFLLYQANSGSDVLKPWDTISSSGSRNFVLCKKELLHPSVLVSGTTDTVEPHAEGPAVLARKGSAGFFKSWLSSLKISSH